MQRVWLLLGTCTLDCTFVGSMYCITDDDGVVQPVEVGMKWKWKLTPLLLLLPNQLTLNSRKNSLTFTKAMSKEEVIPPFVMLRNLSSDGWTLFSSALRQCSKCRKKNIFLVHTFLHRCARANGWNIQSWLSPPYHPHPPIHTLRKMSPGCWTLCTVKPPFYTVAINVQIG